MTTTKLRGPSKLPITRAFKIIQHDGKRPGQFYNTKQRGINTGKKYQQICVLDGKQK